MKQFTIPVSYRSKLIAAIKLQRRTGDKMKKDFTPTFFDLGNLHIYLARHFGFCYGVENAIEIAFETISKNPGKRIFLLSEMIHNPLVNADLMSHGVKFLQDTTGKQLISFESLQSDDIVLIPAFGTTLAIEEKLRSRGISMEKYNTTCPFVERVWNKSEQIARQGYTVVVHGKPTHEETRATFSHAAKHTATVVVNDMSEAIVLGEFITGVRPVETFHEVFAGRFTDGFDPIKDLQRIGVVNQTTMLATDTQQIADYLRQVMTEHYALPPARINERFADTRDTLCYATTDNQSSVKGMLETPANLAIVVGGYNSSNTSHLVELCEEKLPTYFIRDESNLLSTQKVKHWDMHEKVEKETLNFLGNNTPIKILVTSGASCPDAVVEKVILRLAEICGTTLEDIPE
ncbi:MAG: 4-hydroxy-3-methylbut-2-enyl diphosphate reductase [Ferruginibacter sp.]|nr:4-hydroxy-3-methylbut-2-enyl diphosphate reductase [Ferruginibacter sp.]